MGVDMNDIINVLSVLGISDRCPWWRHDMETLSASSRFMSVIYNTTHRTIVTMVKLRPDFAFTNDTLHFALAGELWDVFHEIFKEKWLRSIENALFVWKHWRTSTCSEKWKFAISSRWAPGFSGDHQQNHQCLWFPSYYNVTHACCPPLFALCWE